MHSFFFFYLCKALQLEEHTVSRLFQRRCFYCFFPFLRSTIQYVDNKHFDCLNKNSTHLKLSWFIEHALHSWAPSVCVFQTLWCSGAVTLLLLAS